MRITITLILCACLQVMAGPADGLLPGHWRDLTNTHLRSVVPSPAPTGDPATIMTAWSGGAYDTDREQLIVWGGGHVDYAGNEVYTFGPMNGASAAWTRRTNPSAPDQDCGAAYGDGKPTSTHTYANLIYAPNVQKFYSMGLGSNYPCGSENGQIWSMNVANYTWDAQSANPNFGGNVQGAFSAYDSKTGNIWTRPFGSTNLRCFSPVSKTVVGTYGDGKYLEIYAIGAIDPTRHIMVSVGGYGSTQPTYCWDLDHPGTILTPTTTGDKSAETGGNRGFEFHPPSGKFVAWFGGTSVYTLTPPQNIQTGSWVWTKVNPASDNTVTPSSPASGGTYGRFRYIPSLDVFILVNSIDGDVYLYKLDYGSGVTKSALPSAAGLSLTASPNPFMANTSFSFNLKSRQRVDLSIYNPAGERIATLISGLQNPGLHQVTWAAPKTNSGLFVARAKLGDAVSVVKLFVLK